MASEKRPAWVVPPITPTSTPDDVVSWMSTLRGGKTTLRLFFRAVRERGVDGVVVLSNEPNETTELLGMTLDGDHAETTRSFLLDVARARTSFIVSCVRAETGTSGKSVRTKEKGRGVNKSIKRLLKTKLPAEPAPLAEVQSARLAIPAGLEKRNSIGWLTLKEGFLYKTKKVKRGLHKSTKLRYFMLKQDPITRASQLEYYEGLIRKGVVPLRNTEIRLMRPGAFLLISDGRETELATEASAINEGMAWVMALQQASNSSTPSGFHIRQPHSANPTSVPVPVSGVAASAQPSNSLTSDVSDAVPVLKIPDPPGSPHRRRRGGDDEEQQIDGNAIDEARWAALRMGWERANASRQTGIVMDEVQSRLLDDEDEDVKLMRMLEEEEERRQEEERQAWLAERTAAKAAELDGADHDQSNQSSAQGEVDIMLDEEDGYSEDEVDWAADMQAAEEEEHRRQEEERRQWLAEREAAKGNS